MRYPLLAGRVAHCLIGPRIDRGPGADQSAKGSRTRIVSSRSGLVETRVTGQRISSSTRRIYLIAAAGSSAQLRAPAVVSCQPGIVSHTGSTAAWSAAFEG